MDPTSGEFQIGCYFCGSMYCAHPRRYDATAKLPAAGVTVCAWVSVCPRCIGNQKHNRVWLRLKIWYWDVRHFIRGKFNAQN